MRRMISLAKTTSHRLAAHGFAALAITACAGEVVESVATDSAAEDGIVTLSSTNTEDTTSSSTDDTTAESSGNRDCNDNVFNGDETDVDCGGSCDPCVDGQGCAEASDCQSLACSGGECQSPTCYDEVQNGNEDGIDCGTTCPNACGITGDCNDDDDCRLGEYCTDADTCEPAACDNGVQETRETDVDCGGVDCPDCPPGSTCNVNGDCDSHVCDPATKICAVATCTDGEQNGDETDEDCGGPCPGCANSSSCDLNADCVSGICNDGNCQAPGCNDGVRNGDETAEDCGGQCGPCGNGDGCVDAGDCTSGVCTADVCAVPTCNDDVQNGDETDRDCGGQCGATCSTGDDCFDAGDCIQGVCEFAQCSAPDCLDGVENGDETDLDCGGACGASCQAGEDCIDAGDCEPGVCEQNVCSVPDCFDGIENADETDVDCGASCGMTCETGEQCIQEDDCESGVCTQNTCQAPSCSDAVENGTEDGVDCEGTCPDPCDIGGEILVNTFTADSQLAPAVASAPDGSFFVVAWVSVPIGSPAQDGSGSGVYAQMYDGTGTPMGVEFLVNTTTASNQGNPSVAAWNSGFVVTWESPDSDSGGVFAKRYDDVGAVTTAQFQVNSNSTGLQRRPDVAADNTGAFVICFEDRPAATYDVLCRRYDAAAVAQGIATANATVLGDQQLPSVGRASNGSFVVTWQAANDQDGSGIGVYFRRFDSAGVQLTAETLVNGTTSGNQSQPAVFVNASGEFIIGWSSDDVDGASTAVVARRYSTVGVALGSEFQVNTFTAGAQNNPAIALNGDGDALIAWVSAGQDGNLTGVYGQRYDQDGAAVEAEFRINTIATGFQEEPDLAMLTADQPIVTYSSGSAFDRDVYMRRFTANFP